jgi:hypothetical protein
VKKNAFTDKFMLDNSLVIVYNKDAPGGWQDREECGRWLVITNSWRHFSMLKRLLNISQSGGRKKVCKNRIFLLTKRLRSGIIKEVGKPIKTERRIPR